MKPTEEQQAILDADGRVILINARAGTGKTTTLQMMASAHPDQKILYLVFNRKALPFSLEGNIGAIFGRILDVYWLSKSEGQPHVGSTLPLTHKTKSPILRFKKEIFYQLNSTININPWLGKERTL